jgi:hypothetical protein
MLRTRRLAALSLTIGMLALGTAVALVQPAGAATSTLTVTTTADVSTTTGACGSAAIVVAADPLSLREATCLANNLFTSTGDSVVINLPAGTYNLVNGVLKVGTPQNSVVTIAGAGAASTIIDGGNLGRIISADSNFVGSVSLTLSGITFTHGLSNVNGGGAIIGGSQNLTNPDTITIDSSIITDNHTNTNSTTNTFGSGGGVNMAGGSLTITNTVLSNNSANGSVGLAVSYRAQGHAPVETLTITNDVFTGNTGTNASGQIAGGALSAFSYSAAAHFNVSSSTFQSNVITSTSGTAGGGAISANSGILSVTGSTFTGNAAAGPVTQAGGAILSVGTPTTLQYNRFFNNTANAGNAAYAVGSTTTATENWWGCNTGPNTAGCGTTSGTVTAVPRLVLGVTASPTAVTGPHGVSTVTASLLKDSAGTAVSSAQLGAFAGVPLSWTTPLPSGASATPTSSALVSGQASTSYDSGTGGGAGSLTGGLDNATVAAAITVNAPPVITSATTATFPVGTSTTFIITTTGNPAPALTRTGALPTGLTFTDNGNGTAKIAGTPAAGTGGSYPLTITAANGISPNATQTLTLTVPQAPAFTSPATATFTVGTAGSFTVTTVGPPTVTAITQTGTVPAGLSFTDNGNGTATLSGTPLAGAAGVAALQLSATNGVNPNATQTLTVTVNRAPAVTSDPVSQTAEPGDTVSFTSSATGYPAPTVQWQVSVDGGGAFANIAGANAAQYSFIATLGDSGHQYRAVFINPVASATSTAATLQVGTAPVINSADSTTFTVGVSGTFTVTATGIPAPALTGSGLPAWLTLTDNHDGTATLAGTPPAGSGGTVGLTFHASNGFNPADDQTFTLTIDESPTFTSTNHTAFVTGQQGQFTVTTSPGQPTVTSLTETGTLPNGITFADQGDGTALLSGTAAAGTGGKYTLVLTATAVGGSSTPTSQTFTLSVDEAATFTSADHATFSAGQTGSFTIATGGGYPKPAAITEAGALPDGIDFIDNGEGTATLSGVPTVFGTFGLTLTADNGAGQTSTQSFTLTVDGPPSITSASQMTFTAGLAGTFTVTTSAGMPTATTIVEDGTLPSGITFKDKGDGTAVLAGTATQVGTYQFMITASNGIAPNARQQFVLTIAQAAAVPLPPSVPPSDGALGGIPAKTTPGQVLLHVSGSGFAAGAAITLGLYSPGTVVGHVSADSSGKFSAVITLPTKAGRYTIVATGTGSDGDPRYLEAVTTVTAAPVSSSAAPTPSTSSSPSSSGGLPTTGAQPLRPIGWAVLALIAGFGLIMSARRRTRRH